MIYGQLHVFYKISVLKQYVHILNHFLLQVGMPPLFHLTLSRRLLKLGVLTQRRVFRGPIDTTRMSNRYQPELNLVA